MHRLAAVFALLLLMTAGSASPARAQASPNCASAAEAELQRLPLGPDEVTALRYERRINPREQGPTVIGVRAWVRLNSCSGFLVIDMTRTCFVRQSSTRGNCAVEGVTRY